MAYLIDINGKTYTEAEHGRFDVSLIDEGEEIARVQCNEVIYYSGNLSDVKSWADSYDINVIINGDTHHVMMTW